ncbi:MAG: GNAT family N-acetyltransferase [Specibacter sp.]
MADPHTVVVIHELAVAAQHRGRGLAREYVRRLLADRPESHAVLGVYAQAADAHAMFRRWGFDELGMAHLPGADGGLRVLGCPHTDSGLIADGCPLPWPAAATPEHGVS